MFEVIQASFETIRKHAQCFSKNNFYCHKRHPVHQPRALVSCIHPGLVICFTLDNIQVSMLFSWNIPPSPSPTESRSLFCTSVSLFLFSYRVIITIFLNSTYMCVIGWRGRWEGGSGWGTHVNPWLIHVNVWQKPLQYCKVISLQLIKK